MTQSESNAQTPEEDAYDDPLDRACMLHDQAVEARENGEFEQAERLTLQALALFEVHDGTDTPDVANILGNLGHIQVELAN
jgi:hypothetical protein